MGSLERSAALAAEAVKLTQDEFMVTLLTCLAAVESGAVAEDTRHLGAALYAWSGADVMSLAYNCRYSTRGALREGRQELVEALFTAGLDHNVVDFVDKWLMGRVSLSA